MLDLRNLVVRRSQTNLVAPYRIVHQAPACLVAPTFMSTQLRASGLGAQCRKFFYDDLTRRISIVSSAVDPANSLSGPSSVSSADGTRYRMIYNRALDRWSFAEMAHDLPIDLYRRASPWRSWTRSRRASMPSAYPWIVGHGLAASSCYAFTTDYKLAFFTGRLMAQIDQHLPGTNKVSPATVRPWSTDHPRP